MCGGVWPVVPNKFLDDYVDNMIANVIGFQEQAPCDTHANKNQTIPPSPIPSMTKDVMFEQIHKICIRFQCQMGLKGWHAKLPKI